MERRILMVYDGVLLELLQGNGTQCWFRKQELCMDCPESTKLTEMCRANRRYLDLTGWNWREVSI